MRELICILSAILIFGCTSVNLGNPVLTAAVNVPIAASNTESRSSRNCKNKTGESKTQCQNQVAEIKKSIEKHTQH